jgi:hypothetical protein
MLASIRQHVYVFHGKDHSMAFLKRTLAAAVLTGAMMGSAATTHAADVFSPGVFNQNTMQGWKRTTSGSAMVYGRLPFHPKSTDSTQPQLGFAITAPYRLNGSGVLLHTGAPKLVDLRFNATNFSGGFTTSLHVGSTKAWSYDPTAAPGERHFSLFDSGLSWVGVGLIGAGIIAGTFALTENGS